MVTRAYGKRCSNNRRQILLLCDYSVTCVQHLFIISIIFNVTVDGIYFASAITNSSLGNANNNKEGNMCLNQCILHKIPQSRNEKYAILCPKTTLKHLPLIFQISRYQTMVQISLFIILGADAIKIPEITPVLVRSSCAVLLVLTQWRRRPWRRSRKRAVASLASWRHFRRLSGGSSIQARSNWLT